MTSTDIRQSLLDLLNQIQHEMQAQQLWAGSPPPQEAFDSSTPFFADTMEFSQWLQWVFIPRFHALLIGGHTIPASCDIAPMAEEMFKQHTADRAPLISLLAQFDQHFS